MSRLLLLSGGLDSAAVAALTRPDHCLNIDYGQIPAPAEQRAAKEVAREIGLGVTSLTLGLGPLGAGLMSSIPLSGVDATVGASAEWWPFRNQLLITIAAAWGVTRGFDTVVIGTVASDSARHADGSQRFIDDIDSLVSIQEGHLRVRAPAATMTTVTLIRKSGIDERVLAWTHSCHRANLPCANCPGCAKRAEALHEAGRF